MFCCFLTCFQKTKARLRPYKSLFPHLRLLSKGTPAANEQVGLPWVLYGFMLALNGLCNVTGGFYILLYKVL